MDRHNPYGSGQGVAQGCGNSKLSLPLLQTLLLDMVFQPRHRHRPAAEQQTGKDNLLREEWPPAAIHIMVGR